MIIISQYTIEGQYTITLKSESLSSTNQCLEDTHWPKDSAEQEAQTIGRTYGGFVSF